MRPHSLYQTTKASIQQGIIQMQQNIRKKNQLDLQRDLASALLQQQRLYRHDKQMLELQQIYQDNLKYNNSLLMRTACDPYANSLLYDPAHADPISVGYLEYLENRRRETDQFQHRKRLQRLKEQSLALENRAINGYRAHMYDDKIKNYSSPIQQFSSAKNSPGQSRGYGMRKSPPRNQSINKNLQYDLPLQQDSSALLQKYSKGIRAQQYNRDMERLIQIEKRLKKIQQNSSAAKPYNPSANESLVTPYEPTKFLEQNKSAQKTQERFVKNPHRQVNRINQEQSTNANRQQANGTSQALQKPIETRRLAQKAKVQIFQNQKIGQIINKRKSEETSRGQGQLIQKYPALDQLDDFIKKAQKRNPLAKPVSVNRPYTSKSRNKPRQVSRSLTSAVSPLKSDRVHNRSSYNRKAKRPRTKSSKLQNTSRTNNNVTLKAKQTNSRLLALDPQTQKVFEKILQKHVHDKIQNRMHLVNCVFKDAKLRQQKNEMQALMHRFEIESKGRKEIKNMINNDPKVLRKHKMVVG